MKKVLTILLTIATIAVSAQNKGKEKGADKPKSQKVKNPKTVKTASGLEYTITEKGSGIKAQIGDKVVVHYTGKLTNDTVFDSSVKRGQPFEFVVGQGQVIKGWDEAFQLLQVGDKATIKFGPELGYGAQANGAIPANSTLIFDVELLNVVPAVRQWEAKGKDTMKTASGLKYIIIKENKTGAKVEPGTIAEFHFSGYLAADGKKFDSSVEREKPLSVKVGQHQLLPGWDEGIALMREGEKAKLIIPPSLALGEKGHPPMIPANATLIMDVEVLSVKKIVAPPLYDIKGLEMKTTASGLKYYEVKRSGSTVKATAGKNVKVITLDPA